MRTGIVGLAISLFIGAIAVSGCGKSDGGGGNLSGAEGGEGGAGSLDGPTPGFDAGTGLDKVGEEIDAAAKSNANFPPGTAEQAKKGLGQWKQIFLLLRELENEGEGGGGSEEWFAKFLKQLTDAEAEAKRLADILRHLGIPGPAIFFDRLAKTRLLFEMKSPRNHFLLARSDDADVTALLRQNFRILGIAGRVWKQAADVNGETPGSASTAATLYRCGLPSRAYLITTRANCDNTGRPTIALGFISTTRIASNVVPLYRMYKRTPPRTYRTATTEAGRALLLRRGYIDNGGSPGLLGYLPY